MENVSLLILSFCWCLAFSQTILQNYPQNKKSEADQRVDDLIVISRKQAYYLQDIMMRQRELLEVLNTHAAAITTITERLQTFNNETANATGGIVKRPQLYISVPDLPSHETYLRKEPGCSFDIIFVIDSSNTNCLTYKYQQELQFCKNLLEEADIDSGQVRVGMLTYSFPAEIQFHLNTYSKKRVLFEAMDRVACSGGERYTGNALSKASNVMFSSENGDRPGADNIIVLITDGYSTVSPSRTIPEAENAKTKNIQIYTISINDRYFAAEVLTMASKPTEKYAHPLPGMNGLHRISKKIYNFICEDAN